MFRVLLILGAILCTAASSHAGELVAYYPFNGNANDASGHANNGVVHSALLTADCHGQPNSAYDFNGTSAYIEAPGTASLRVPGVTLAAWVYLRHLTDPSGYDTFIRKQYLFNDSSYEIGVVTATGLPDFSINRGSGNPADGIVLSTVPLALNSWHHVAGTYNGSVLKIYIDGVLRGAVPYSIPVSYDSGTLTLGAIHHPSGMIHYVDGTMDDMRVYDYALDQGEILGLAASCFPVPEIEIEPIGPLTLAQYQSQEVDLFARDPDGITWTVERSAHVQARVFAGDRLYIGGVLGWTGTETITVRAERGDSHGQRDVMVTVIDQEYSQLVDPAFIFHRWDTQPVRIYLDRSSYDGPNAEAIWNAVLSGCLEWGRIEILKDGAVEPYIRMQEVGSEGDANVVITFDDQPPCSGLVYKNWNAQCIEHSGLTYETIAAHSYGFLGFGCPKFTGRSKITLNCSLDWTDDMPGQTYTEWTADCETVVQHEFGHALGLGDMGGQEAEEWTMGHLTPDESDHDFTWDRTLSSQDIYALVMRYQRSDMALITSYCPVDLEVVTPSGVVINRQTAGTDGSTAYIEADFDDPEYGDLEDMGGQPEELDDQIWIGDPAPGTYLLRITPEAGAGPEDSVAVVIGWQNQAWEILRNLQIQDLSGEGYRVSLAPEAFGWEIDIKPGSCPNPVNPKANGVLPVAIIGSRVLPVSAINTSSLRLGGVASPVRAAIEDVTGPAAGDGECPCRSQPDGWDDLVLHFRASDLRSLFEGARPGDVLHLELTGLLSDVPFAGGDCITVVGNRGGGGKAAETVDMHVISPIDRQSESTIVLTLPEQSQISLEVFDASGRMVDRLSEGVWQAGRHEVRWPTRTSAERGAAAGVYLVRFRSPGEERVRKIVVTR